MPGSGAGLHSRSAAVIAGAILLGAGLCWICGRNDVGLPGCDVLPVAGPTPAEGSGSDGLEDACRQTAGWVRRILGPGYSSILRSPMVLAGDLSEADLDRWHRTVIEPARRAMAASYFAAPPTEPITVLLFGSERRYREDASRLFGDCDVSRYGYYRPHLRSMLVNLETGSGGLLHELTHALMAFDFPNAPEWLSEGLASLHERADLSEGGKVLVGLPNWRLALVQEARRARRLPPVRTLIVETDFRGPREALNYAHARCFCHYLQDRGVLVACYRACRNGAATDPRGAAAVARLSPDSSWNALNADFLRWLDQSTEPSGSVDPLGMTTTPSQIMPCSASPLDSRPEAFCIRTLLPMRQFLSIMAFSILEPGPTPSGGRPSARVPSMPSGAW